MKVTILIDNTPGLNKSLYYEHGLSMYFEFENYKWLFDVGASSHFYDNAVKMGIDISSVDYLVVSHAHADHTGGLEKFLEVNRTATLYASKHIINKKFYSCRKLLKRDISPNEMVFKQYNNRFKLIENNTQITPNASLICNIPKIYCTPYANKSLFISDNTGEYIDNFLHEITLTINTPKGLVVFSGCSHNGLLNILVASTKQYPYRDICYCIGGTHLIDSDEQNQYESVHDIEKIVETIKTNYPKMHLITGHCSGEKASIILSNLMKDKFSSFYTGSAFNL